MIEFFIPLKRIPGATSQQKGVNFDAKKIYTKDSVLSVKALYKSRLAEYVPYAPFTGPVELRIGWCYPRGKHKNGEWKTTKPDTDNLIKLLKDCMTELGFWKDDAQVALETSWKRYADVSGVLISIRELEGPYGKHAV